MIIKPEKTLFIISRASLYHRDNPNVDMGAYWSGAFLAQKVRVDVRSVDSPDKLVPFLREDWYKEGTNHRVVNGHIARDVGFETVWAIYIRDLIEFIKVYGMCIISHQDDGFNDITIYDAYVE